MADNKIPYGFKEIKKPFWVEVFRGSKYWRRGSRIFVTAENDTHYFASQWADGPITYSNVTASKQSCQILPGNKKAPVKELLK